MYAIGTTVLDRWIITRKLGNGSFGHVYEIQRKDFGETYRAALKVITVPRDETELRSTLDDGMSSSQAERYFYSVVEDVVREFALMAKLKGTANIVSYEDHQVVRHADGIGWDILIRMELLTPVIPYASEHPFSRRDIIRLGIDICRALELCQKYNIIHRDIKPDNIFVSDIGDFKLGDFGIARTIEKTMSGLSKKGTYNYMAPEVYRGEEYGFGVDIYSLGMVLYRLLNKNRMPFLPPAPQAITYRDQEKAMARRMNGERLPKPFYSEGRLSEIVLKACSPDPMNRYSSPAQMRSELEAIMYDQSEAELIYPYGDELFIPQNKYASNSLEDDTQLDDGEFAENDTLPIDDSGSTVSDIGGHYGTTVADDPTELPLSDTVYVQLRSKQRNKKPKQTKRKATAFGVAVAIVAGFVFVVCVLASFRYYIHFWSDATCIEASVCKICGKTGTEARGHDWESATCTEPQTCVVCGITEGEPLGHDWESATCTEPQTCVICGITEGEPLGHDWEPATYTQPQTCRVCGITDGNPVSDLILNSAAEYASQGLYRQAIQILDNACGQNARQEYYDAAVQYRMEFGIYNTSRFAAGGGCTVYLCPDGTVMVVGDDTYGESAAGYWTDIVAVSAGDQHTVGLRADGTVVAVGGNKKNQCAVQTWQDIVAISAGDEHTVGLMEDGTVVAAGYNENGQCNVDVLMRTAGSRRVVSIAAGYVHTLALLEDGTVVACGDNSNGACNVSGWRDIVAIYAGSEYSAGLRSDGTVVVTGNIANGQNVSGWTNINNLAAGDYFLIGVRADGSAVSVLLPLHSGAYSKTGWEGTENWRNIVCAAAGNGHSVGIDSNGQIWFAGSNNRGQCTYPGSQFYG